MGWLPGEIDDVTVTLADSLYLCSELIATDVLWLISITDNIYLDFNKSFIWTY